MRRLAITAYLIMSAAIAGAVQPGNLPAFDVTAGDGSVVNSTQIARNGKWLLIFVKTNCPQCESVLSALDSAPTQNGARVAIIVKSPTPNALTQLKARYPRIPAAAWYADVHAGAASSLRVPASPTTLGMRGSAVAWRLTGAVSALPTDESSGIKLTADAATDPHVREHSLLNGWLTQP